MKRDWHDFDCIEEEALVDWYSETTDECWQIKDNNTGDVVAEVFSPELSMDKTIHLLAQAPEMLHALQQILKAADEGKDPESFKWRVQHLAKMQIIKLERAQA